MKKRMIFIILSLFSLLVCVACSGGESGNTTTDDEFEDPSTAATSTIELSSYTEDNYTFDTSVTNKDGSVSYEIFVRSFYDADGDGTGDFKGVEHQLGYLEDLGVKTLWLMPIMPSPSYHGYDVIDYYDVNSQYGTMADFESLVTEAAKHNIDIMIDIVFNHSSTRCAWFQQAIQDYKDNNTNEGSKKDWYCWSENSKTGYSICNENHAFYESRFDSSMPDFNTKNEEVVDEMVNILKFWSNKGVKGFRFDAVKYYDYNVTSYNVQFLKTLVDRVHEDYPDRYFVGEMWEDNDYNLLSSYYSSGFDSFFTFTSAFKSNGDASLLGQIKSVNNANSFGSMIESREKLMKQKNPNGYSSYFFTNHDMDRASNNLQGVYSKLGASLLYLMPGTPYMYYGEEIQLKGKRVTSPEDASDARRRLPMIWSSTDSTGLCKFPESTRMDLSTGNDQVTTGALDAQAANYSIWNHYKKVINIRNKYPFIKNSVFTNKTKLLNTSNTHILAYELSYGDEKITVIHNFNSFNLEVDVSQLGSAIADEVSVFKLKPELKDGKLRIGKMSTVILK